jgi:hypothetical protein
MWHLAQIPAQFDIRSPVIASVDCGVGVGIAASPALEVIVITNAHTSSLSVFGLLAPCPLLHTIGGDGAGPLQFKDIARVCFTVLGDDTVLVAEGGNDRVQEVDVMGPSHVAFWGVGLLEGPRGVAACRTLVAVTEQGAKRVSLFDSSTRALLRWCGGPESSSSELLYLPRGLCFSDHGLRVIVADASGALLEYNTADGNLVNRLHDDTVQGALDVVPYLGGLLIVDCIKNAVLPIARSSSLPESLAVFASLVQLGREGDAAGQFRGPSALVLVPGVGLLVREREGARFQLFG